MNVSKIAVGAIIAGMALSLAACSGGNNDEGLPALPSSSSSAESSQSVSSAGGVITGVTDPKKRPTVKTLNSMLNVALDPKVSNMEKTKLVEGSEKDPAVFDKLVQARKDNPDATYKIFPPVIPAGPRRATVKVQLKVGENPPTKAEASIVYVDGRWKLSKDTVCPLLDANNFKTAMCPPTAASTTNHQAYPGR